MSPTGIYPGTVYESSMTWNIVIKKKFNEN